MKLVCNICVANRHVQIKLKNKHVKSTLALCKHPSSTEYCLILFTNQDKNGTKYPLKNNIQQILTRFVNEGKATIQLKAPPHDLYIQSDVIQLKAFLHLLKRVLENKVSEKEMSISSMAVTAAVLRDIAPIKLIITNRSEYPSKGFPRTLEILHINDIKRCGLDRGILQLVKLRVLNLSNNCIETIPEELNRLPSLRELNLSRNCLRKSNLKQWGWLGGTLAKNLLYLDMSHNSLLFVPDQIVKLQKLVTLHINDNLLKVLPSGMGNLRSLKIFSAANNYLLKLPGSVVKWSLQSIDLSNNDFEQLAPNIPGALFPKPLGVLSLKETAARKVLWSRIPYAPGTLPMTVIDFVDHAKFCICGKACFDNYLRHSNNLFLSDIAKTISTTSGELAFIPIDCYFCSLRCFGSAFRTRPRRGPIVR